MNVITHTSTQRNISAAIEECTKSMKATPKLILFFASPQYDFKELTETFHNKFPESEILGTTTAGEIGEKGMLENSLTAVTLDSTTMKVKGFVIEDVDKYPVFSRKKVMDAMSSVGLSSTNERSIEEGFCIKFTNGLINAEEKALSTINSAFDYSGFTIFGGTAADGFDFKQTFVSYNGKVYTNATVAVFVKISEKFKIYKENIFKSTGKTMTVTKVNLENRIVYEFDHQKATSRYSKLLGVSESELSNRFASNPTGRNISGNISIASPYQVNTDGSLQFYCQITLGTKVDILEPLNTEEVMMNTVNQVKNDFNKIDGVLAINCLLRKVQFMNENTTSKINSHMSKLNNLAGFTSYGEQLNKTQLNQTLILLAIGQ